MSIIYDTWFLYRHTSPSGKVYIGITCQKPEHRWANGKGYMNTIKGPFKSTIIKYGWDNIKHEVLFSGLSEDRAKLLEIELIRHYKCLGISLNITDGGEGVKGITPWNKGMKIPYEKTNKRKGCHLTEEHKRKLSIAHKGKHHKGRKLSKEHIKKLSSAHIGTHVSEETKKKISEHSAKSRRVIEYNPLGIILAEFTTAREAAKNYNLNESWVARACRSKILCNGHIFVYADNNTKFSDVRYGRYKKGKSITIQNINTSETFTFHSLSTCARFVGIKSATTIRKAIAHNYVIKGVWNIKKG